MRLTVLIVDDDDSFRELLKRALGGAVEVVGEGATGEEAVRLAAERRPDAVLLDIGIPGLDAIEVTRQVKVAAPQTKVVLLTLHDEEAYLSSTGKSGADALLAKRQARTEALALLRRVVGRPRVPWDGRERRGRGAGSPGEWNGRERRKTPGSTQGLGDGPTGG